MKIYTIPDVHGTKYWQRAVPMVDEYDKIVFLGDYVDNWDYDGDAHLENLKHIIA